MDVRRENTDVRWVGFHPPCCYMSMMKTYLKGTGHQGVVNSGFGQDGQVDVEEAYVDGAGDDGDGGTLNHLVSML
jgi:hypothetical protein